MTPQEHQLVEELFGRLAKLENMTRDPQAERLIADGLQRAPHAAYALVQTTLVQDEALKRANERIEELQSRPRDSETREGQGGFLDSMREAVLGRRDPQGATPTVRSPPTQASLQREPGSQSQAPYPAQASLQREPGSQSQVPYPPQTPPPSGPGGSFLGNAASTAAGVVGGSLLLNSIRSMFGNRSDSGTQDLGRQDQSALGSLGGQASSRDASASESDQDDSRGGEQQADQDDADSSDQSDDADFTDDADYDDQEGPGFDDDDSDY
jgi:uncharacterized protein